MGFFVAKSMFFDRQAVLGPVRKAKLRNLSRGGAFIRQTARTSMRYRKSGTSSSPGAPPFAHRPNAYVRQRLFFGYDARTQSVVVGPELLNTVNLGTFAGRGTVPLTLERGGEIGVREIEEPGGTWKRVPLGYKLGAPRRVPVWSATSAEKAAAVGKVTTVAGGHAVNFYLVPGAVRQRVRYAKVAARPYMGPALKANLPKLSGLWANSIAG